MRISDWSSDVCSERASITETRHKVDVNTQAALSATQLALNEVGSCNLELDRAIAFERYADNRKLGGFILIDRQTHATVACGTIDFALRRAANLHWQSLDIDKAARARSKRQDRKSTRLNSSH